MSRGKPTRNVIVVYSVDLRGSRCKSRHPGLKESPPELERVLSDKDKVDGLQHGELVEEDARDHRHDEEEKLRHDDAEVGHAEDLGADDARDADGGDPHDAVDHGQDDLVDDGKKLDDGLGPRAEGAEDSSEGQAEEDDAEGVGSGPMRGEINFLYVCDISLLFLFRPTCLPVRQLPGELNPLISADIDVLGVGLERGESKAEELLSFVIVTHADTCLLVATENHVHVFLSLSLLLSISPS